jgi:hypothetical protein
MAFEEGLREKIINFTKLNEVLDKIGKKRRDVLRLLANLTLSKNFDVKIITDKHIQEAFEAIRVAELDSDRETKEKTVTLTCISCLCVILNLTSKGLEINKKFIDKGLIRYLKNLIQSHVSDQKVVPLSFMILANLMTYPTLPNQILNETIDTLKVIHDMTHMKLRKDIKYSPEDKIFNKIFFLLAYTRFNLNCLLQGLMDKIKQKFSIEKYFEVFFEIFLNVDLAQNNLILLTGRIIYYMIMNSDRLYDILVKKDAFYKRIIQIISGKDFDNVIKGKFDVFSNGVSRDKVGQLLGKLMMRIKYQMEMDRARMDPDGYSVKPNDEIKLDEHEKAASQSRMIAFLLLRLISKKEKSTNIFFYKGMDNLIKFIYMLFQRDKITDEEKESIILFYSNIISSKQVLEKLQKMLKYIVLNFQKYLHPNNSDTILLACMQFFLQLSKNPHHHASIAKTDFLYNMASVYKKNHPRLRQLIQILLSNISFSYKTHPFLIESRSHHIIEQVDEKEDDLKKYMNISKLNMALNYKSFMYLRTQQSTLTEMPLINAINPVGQIKLYVSALQYIIREGPRFFDVDKIDPELFPDFVDPIKEEEKEKEKEREREEREKEGHKDKDKEKEVIPVLPQISPDKKKESIIHTLETCFKNLIESLTNQSVYIINRAIYLTLILIDHPYLPDVKFNAPNLLIVVFADLERHFHRLLFPRWKYAYPSSQDPDKVADF